MNILVCIKQVPGTSKVQVDEKTGVLIRSGIDTKMNPYDLYALETALQIKSSAQNANPSVDGVGPGELVTVQVISMGPPQATEVIREAFMMGADEGALLTDRKFAGADCLATSYAISQAIRKLGLPDLIICGKQTTDGDTAQVGPEIAEFLDLPHVTNVRKIRAFRENAQGRSIVVEMDLPEQIAVMEMDMPCLITVEKGIFQPRLPSYRLKQASRERKIQTLTWKDMEDQDETRYGLKGSPTQVIRIFPPESTDNNEIWRGSDQELSERLAALFIEKKLLGD